MYAIIKTGGQQYRVAAGETLDVGRLTAKVGEQVTFNEVLMLGGEQVVAGSSALQGASVSAQVMAHTRGPKLLGMKYKPKKFYRRKVGNRADLTRVQITNITTT